MKEIPIEDAQSLSSRQYEVITLAAHGFTDIAMAHKLGISEGTVGTHWSRIRAKMGPYSRTELVAKGLRSDLQRKLDALEQERDALLTELQRFKHEVFLYQSAVNSMQDGILAIGADGRIESANPSATRLFGYGERCLRGRDLVKLIPERYREAIFDRFSESLRSPSIREANPVIETTGLCRCGDEIPLSLTFSVVHRSEGTLVIAIVRAVATPPASIAPI